MSSDESSKKDEVLADYEEYGSFGKQSIQDSFDFDEHTAYAQVRN